MQRIISPAKRVSGTVEIPGDKSISHRALMISAIAEGKSIIENISQGMDVQCTAACLREMGVDIQRENNKTYVTGKGLTGLKKPKIVLNVGNSGTTIRLLSGILAGQSFTSIISGDESIKQRPMDRIIKPLQKMGAEISAEGNTYAPLRITGGELTPIEYQMPVASAQVKSCVLFAGLFANGRTTVHEKAITRNHTELMLSQFGATIQNDDLKVIIDGPAKLTARQIYVPGDLSSAAFFLAAATLVKDSSILVKNVGINPTRKVFLELLCDFGARVELINVRTMDNELMADLLVESAELHGLEISGAIVPQIIDEIPIIAVLATQAKGKTVISDAKELRYKESDRIRSIAFNLQRMGVDVTETEDGLIIQGPVKLQPAQIESFNDHRIAMSFAIAGLIAQSDIKIINAECADISFPGFYRLLREVVEN